MMMMITTTMTMVDDSYPPLFQSHYRAGMAAAELPDQRPEAVAHFTRALALDPHNHAIVTVRQAASAYWCIQCSLGRGYHHGARGH
jgi:hypothetical protein